ncbi:hypothetical protein ACK8HX_13210 [Oryzobacter sp. R7]|uniref:hypothetical protein n=1 Tax=Oryzobacter faecalis TaxID=3388656 RepID=UPI00398CB016
MPKTTPTLRPVDTQRGARLLIAWLDGDELAVAYVLDEANRDPAGTAGLLFAITHTAALLAETAAPEGTPPADGLRALLLDDQRDQV